ncbi:MAG: hypothetical protein GAK43_02547 [Stenotrophomonas maltophilia]|nr:MAG: hypothetical protein GAK43_02547 [Stenotrophomonas maltophilia]
MTTERGAALIVALWVLGLLSVLMVGVIATVRLENQQSQYELDQLRARLAAQAGLALALEALAAPTASGFEADGRPSALTYEGMPLTVWVESERGKLDLNSTDAGSVERLLSARGASPEQTRQLIQALQHWQAAGRRLETFEQLYDVPSMDAALLERLSPDITLWTGLGAPDPVFASPALQQVLGLSPGGLSNGPGSLFTLRSVARLPNGSSSGLQATLHLLPGGGSGPLYRVLRWQE